jgi:hypothetical protein
LTIKSTLHTNVLERFYTSSNLCLFMPVNILLSKIKIALLLKLSAIGAQLSAQTNDSPWSG